MIVATSPAPSSHYNTQITGVQAYIFSGNIASGHCSVQKNTSCFQHQARKNFCLEAPLGFSLHHFDFILAQKGESKLSPSIPGRGSKDTCSTKGIQSPSLLQALLT